MADFQTSSGFPISESQLAEINLTCGNATGLPNHAYTSEEFFELERQQIFSTTWTCVGNACSIPNTGDVRPVHFLGVPLLMVRGKDNALRVFHNVCSHRGNELVWKACSVPGLIRCPYHSWTYGLDGSLKAARYMPEEFSPEQHGLHKCHIRIYHGFIFLNLSSGVEPEFEAEFEVFAPHLDFHGFTDAKIACKQSYPTQANWKLVVENFFECYHCAPAHPEFCSRHSRDALVAAGAGPSSGAAEAMERFRPELEAWEAEASKLGRPLGSVDDDEHSPHLKFCQQRPHRKDIKSETQDGEPVACLMGRRRAFDHGRMHLSFSPFNQIIACNDFAVLIVFTPCSAMRTNVDISWLVDGRATTVDVDRMIWMWDVTTKQDKEITENNQRGINSSRYQPGRLSNQEQRVATFNNWYLRQLTT